MLNGLDLFTGIAGITVALKNYVRPIAYCERDLYCITVLLERMRSGQIPKAPICTDITKLQSESLEKVDCIYGGFPCQDISVAGNGIGLEGERSGLFFEIIRLVSDIRPRFVFLENVPAITVRGLDRVLLEFTSLGYDCRWTIVSASEIGAHHKRERWFLLAYADSAGFRDEWQRSEKGKTEANNFSGNDGKKSKMADSMCAGWNDASVAGRRAKKHPAIEGMCTWETEPNVGRVVDGLPFRMDRIKSLGNSVVPVQVTEAFERLLTMNQGTCPWEGEG